MAISSASGIDAAPRKQTLSSNYVDFTSAATEGWAQQYLPDLMEKEAEVYGKRTIAGFLAQVGAEEASTSDRVIWSEQGRLHLAYTAKYVSGNNKYEIENDIDGNDVGTTPGLRVGDMVIMSLSNATAKGYISAVDPDGDNGAEFTVLAYGNATMAGALGSTATTSELIRVLVIGSEFEKGTDGRSAANSPKFKSHSNKHIIMKDYYEVSGSDTSQIGWVEVSGEEGQNGYLWYLKAEGDTRARFNDYLEMTMLEAETAIDGAGAIGGTDGGALQDGTQGLFQAITTRGHQTTGVTGVNAATDLAEFDAILAVFDQNGAI
jgi:hypothetical protein